MFSQLSPIFSARLFPTRFFLATGLILMLMPLSGTVNAQNLQHFPVRSTAGWTPQNAQLRSPFWGRRILPATPPSIGYSRYARPNYRSSWYSNRPNNGWGGTGYHPAPWQASQTQGGWLPSR